MGFEIVSPQSTRTALEPYTCRLTRGGKLILRRSEAIAVGVHERATLLADAGTRRIMVRAPRDGELSWRAHRPSARKQLPSVTAFGVVAALAVLGIAAEEVCGGRPSVVLPVGRPTDAPDALTVQIPAPEAEPNRKRSRAGRG